MFWYMLLPLWLLSYSFEEYAFSVFLNIEVDIDMSSILPSTSDYNNSNNDNNSNNIMFAFGVSRRTQLHTFSKTLKVSIANV
jgi:hypothetical protein